MDRVEYYGTVLDDGHLSLNEECAEQLGLKTGARVKVVLTKVEGTAGSQAKDIVADGFEQLLAEGYVVSAERDKRICEEFRYVDAENLPPEY